MSDLGASILGKNWIPTEDWSKCVEDTAKEVENAARDLNNRGFRDLVFALMDHCLALKVAYEKALLR